MTDSLARDSTERIRRMVETAWVALASITIPMMLALFFFSEPIVKLYLGNKFRGLGPEFGIISLSLLPTVAVVLFRGHLDGKLKISPIMYANTAGVITIGVVTWILLDKGIVTLRAIAWTIVIIRWVQFAFVMWLLRYLFGVSVYSHEAARQVWAEDPGRLSANSGREADTSCCSTQFSSYKSHFSPPRWAVLSRQKLGLYTCFYGVFCVLIVIPFYLIFAEVQGVLQLQEIVGKSADAKVTLAVGDGFRPLTWVCAVPGVLPAGVATLRCKPRPQNSPRQSWNRPA